MGINNIKVRLAEILSRVNVNHAGQETGAMSSESFHGQPVDIIDLDRYMRASAPPSRQRQVQRCGDLIVDAGGVSRGRSSGSESYAPAPHHKRYSHDSGVSDGSYMKRRPRHKHNERDRSRDQSRYESASAMSQFRVSCEQALLEQQKQISRLAELCERLVPNTPRNSGTKDHRVRSKSCSNKEYSSPRKPKSVPTNQLISDSSDTSISSETSKDVRRKTRKSDSCKTYKIMMDRLEDLSRVLTNRKPQTVVSKPYPSSVVVCNKLIATEPDRFVKHNNPTVRKIVCENDEYESPETERSRKDRFLEATRAQVLNITPALVEHSNVVTERVFRGSSSSGTIHDLDLDNPIHFYEQAKRLQTLHTSTKHGQRPKVVTETMNERDATLCALCRTYWRAVRNCLVQTFGAYT